MVSLLSLEPHFLGFTSANIIIFRSFYSFFKFFNRKIQKRFFSSQAYLQITFKTSKMPMNKAFQVFKSSHIIWPSDKFCVNLQSKHIKLGLTEKKSAYDQYTLSHICSAPEGACL